MNTEQMRLSPAKLLIVVALCIVILVELRTVLAFFGIEVAVVTSLVVGAFVVGVIVLWAMAPLFKRADA